MRKRGEKNVPVPHLPDILPEDEQLTAQDGDPAPKARVARGDFIMVVIVIVLEIFGVVMVFSASYYGTIADQAGPYYYLIRAAAWAAGGLVLFIIMAVTGFKWIFRIAPLIFFVSLTLLFLLLFTPLGVTRGGATRWIEIGPITIMPGEIIKIGFIIFIAWFYTALSKHTRSFVKGFLPILFFTGVCFFLIYKQPNLSTAVIVCGIAFVMMYFAGVNLGYIAGSAAVGIGLVALLVLKNPDSEHLKRISGYLQPFDDAQGEFYQLVQSLLALGAGGVFGVGPGRSVQKALYLPEAQNDFIFAIIGEELGFVGCVVLLLVYLVLIWRCVLIAMNAPSRFTMLLASGITIMLALQVVMNVGVVTGLLPPTGVTLPFISYGGNATLLFMGSMGIMLGISLRSAPKTKKTRTPKSKRVKISRKNRALETEANA